MEFPISFLLTQQAKDVVPKPDLSTTWEPNQIYILILLLRMFQGELNYQYIKI